ncbi:MAG: cytochrome c [Planctomycetaceae bacterium]
MFEFPRPKRMFCQVSIHHSGFQRAMLRKTPVQSLLCGIPKSGNTPIGTKVVVHPKDQFEQWLVDASNIFKKVDAGEMSMIDVGKMLYEKRGCVQCHSMTESQDGKKGPPFKGNFGKEVAIKGGTKVVVDENYLLESIKDPAAKVRDGYDNIMPNFNAQFREEREYIAVVEFIKSLNGVGSDLATPEATSSEGEPSDEPKPE